MFDEQKTLDLSVNQDSHGVAEVSQDAVAEPTTAGSGHCKVTGCGCRAYDRSYDKPSYCDGCGHAYSDHF